VASTTSSATLARDAATLVRARDAMASTTVGLWDE